MALVDDPETSIPWVDETGRLTQYAYHFLLGLWRRTGGNDDDDIGDLLASLGSPSTDGEMIVATGSTGFQYESGATLRGSIGANIDEANTFFGNTDLTGAQAETLSDGSNADALHAHAHNSTTGLQGGSASERYHLTQARHTEITDFFDATDLTGAEAETLSDGSNADSLHIHSYLQNLTVDTTAVGNVGAGEDDLITYTLPANTLDADDKYITIHAFGTTGANGNNKTIKLHLGSTELTAATANTPNDQDWCFTAHVIRTGSSAGKSIVKFLSNDSNEDTVQYKSISEDFTTNLTIKCTGEGTADDDIVQEGLIVELVP